MSKINRIVLLAGLIYANSWGGELATGQKGMVASSQELATQAGLEILQAGGNAVDAAVAVGYALAVVHPAAGNIGGGGFMLILLPDGQKITIDFREKAPLAAHRDMFLDANGEFIMEKSTRGYLASGVPGSVAGLNLALEKYGSLKLAQVLAPAIRLAQEGFALSNSQARDFVRHADDFKQFPPSAKKFLKKDGFYQAGENWRQPELTKTLKLIAKQGTRAFYQGKIAKLIAKDMKKNGGLITLADLAHYQPVERPPVVSNYRDYEVISMGPPSSGGIALIQMLNVLEPFNLAEKGFNSPAYLHVLVEAMRRAYADRAVHLGDRDFYPVPIAGLIAKAYADSLRQSIRMERATPSAEIQAGNPGPVEGNHTTHYCVVDQNHLVVAVTTTINTAYGSFVVVDKAGFLLNNEMDDFSAKPGAANVFGLVGNEANAIAPQKRMLSSMTPTILTRNGRFFLTVGAQGGPRIITTVLQTILNVVEHGMNIQQAVDAPRIHHQWLPDSVFFEADQLAPETVAALQVLGHQLQPVHYKLSEAEAILFEAELKQLTGAADSRYSGVAKGY